MDLNSAGGTPKRSRSKAKATEPGAEPAAKSVRSRKTKTPEPTAIAVTSITTIAKPSENELLGMIATAAYFRAEQRSFAPGHDLEDWLEAERQIRTLYT